MNGAAIKRKGAAYERELVSMLEGLGYEARRVYASGAVGTILKQSTGNEHEDLTGDVQALVNGVPVTFEVKFRKHHFPVWLRELDKVTVFDGWVAYPGTHLADALKFRGEKKWMTPTTTRTVPEGLTSLLGQAQILALRFPKNKANPSGWVFMVPMR